MCFIYEIILFVFLQGEQPVPVQFPVFFGIKVIQYYDGHELDDQFLPNFFNVDVSSFQVPVVLAKPPPRNQIDSADHELVQVVNLLNKFVVFTFLRHESYFVTLADFVPQQHDVVIVFPHQQEIHAEDRLDGHHQ